jgi:hypothetical protein
MSGQLLANPITEINKMKVGVKLKINVSMIEKARLFAGKKGKYLDATVFIDVDNKDQYENNGMITQDVSKEEKDSGVKGPILGNVQVFWRDDNNAPQQANQQAMQQQAPQTIPAGDDKFDDDIPF